MIHDRIRSQHQRINPGFYAPISNPFAQAGHESPVILCTTETLPYHIPGITRFVYSLCRLLFIRLVKYLIHSRSDLNVDTTPRPNRQ